MKPYLISLAIPYALLGLMNVSQAAETTFRGIALPERVGGFVRQAVTNNESAHPGYGLTVAYGTNHVKATVFIYDRQLRLPHSDLISPEVEAEAIRSLAEISKVNSNFSILEPLAPSTCPGFLRAKLSYVERGEADGDISHSYLYVGSRKANFVKTRVTFSMKRAFTHGVLAESKFSSDLCKHVETKI